MGYQHGVALKSAIQRGVIPYFQHYLPRVLQPMVGRQGARVVHQLLHQLPGKKLFAAFPAEIQAHMRALAEGAELPLEQVTQAFVLPDLFLWLVSRSNLLKRPPMAPQLGCSSVFVQGAASKQGMLHGRNLDYMGVGHWDAEPAILFYQPDQGQRYVSVSSAGIPLGGVTAMNEAGLTLAVHQHLSCLNIALKGTPIGVAGDQVMRRAENLNEALAILESFPPNVCWTYLIASAEEQALLCYETTGKGSKWQIVKEDQFAYTNFYLDPELAALETHLYPSQWRSNQGRYQALCAGLQQQPLDANDVAGLLAHPGAERCRLSQPVAMLFTVSSSVMQPAERRVYAAAGPVPTSQRLYWAFDLKQQAPSPELPPLNGGLPDPVADAAFSAFREAYSQWFAGDSGAALKAMAQACKLAPQEALYPYLAGLLSLDLRLPDQAVNWLHQAIGRGHSCPERLASFYLWRARAFDMSGLRERAVQDYAWVTQHPADLAVKQAAEKGLKRRWRWRPIGLEFNYADVMSP